MITKPKIVQGMEASSYHAVKAASSSRMKAILRSPAHLRHIDEHGIQAAALVLGDAFHTAVLEPEIFDSRFVLAPECDRRTKDGKATYEAFTATLGSRKALSADDLEAINGMKAAIEASPTAADLVNNRTETEVSLFWEECGIVCKARFDAINPAWKCIVDLKTTQDASAAGFAKSIVNFGYHIQAAWYIRAARLAGFDIETMVFIAVEKTAPYGVGCYIVDGDSIEQGLRDLAIALPMLSNCQSTDTWPSYTEGIHTLKLPRWAVKEEEVTL